MTRRGRPLGEISQSVYNLIAQRARAGAPLTVRTVAGEAQLTYADAKQLVKRLASGGHVQYGQAQPTGGSRPPRSILPAGTRSEPAQQLHFVMGMMVRTRVR
jgi:hypothetical protein